MYSYASLFRTVLLSVNLSTCSSLCCCCCVLSPSPWKGWKVCSPTRPLPALPSLATFPVFRFSHLDSSVRRWFGAVVHANACCHQYRLSPRSVLGPGAEATNLIAQALPAGGWASPSSVPRMARSSLRPTRVFCTLLGLCLFTGHCRACGCTRHDAGGENYSHGLLLSLLMLSSPVVSLRLPVFLSCSSERVGCAQRSSFVFLALLRRVTCLWCSVSSSAGCWVPLLTASFCGAVRLTLSRKRTRKSKRFSDSLLCFEFFKFDQYFDLIFFL